MLFFNFILLFVILILLLQLKSSVNTNAKSTKLDIEKIKKALIIVKNVVDDIKTPQNSPNEELSKPKVTWDDAIKQERIVQAEKAKIEKKISLEKKAEPIKKVEKQVNQTVIKEPVQSTPAKPVSLPQYKKTFFEKYPDIEKFIGENLINKIGIVILVLGLGFFVKYAIDKNWINEIGRVAIGVLSASVLLALAHKLRKEYTSFSSVLIGGGLALLYFTITLAYHTKGYPLYQQQTTTFILLLFITIFAVFLYPPEQLHLYILRK